MMMETVVYSREFLFVEELYKKGELGKVQFLQASHQQDMDGWPDYWPGLPPMHYATHCVGPCLALTRAEAEYVSCFGSGRIREELIPKYGSPFAVEIGPRQVAELGRGGPHLSLAVRHGPAVPRKLRRIWLEEDVRVAPDRRRRAGAAHGQEAGAGDSSAHQGARLRASAARSDPAVHDQGGLRHRREQHLSFTQGGGHGGSHPHLAHEFLSALARAATRSPTR